MPHEIDLYTWATPNGWKVSATLEELALPYNLYPVDITTGVQKEPAFLGVNPNGRIPAIVDHAHDGLAIFESGAIMIHLAEKTGRLLPVDTKGRAKVIQWLMFQMAGVGPMQGQANVFYRYLEEKIPTAIQRYQNETRRLYGVLNHQLSDREFLADDFSVADIAHWSWVRIHNWAGIDIAEFDHLNRWLKQLEARPALQRGASVPHTTNYNTPSDRSKDIAVIRKMVSR